MANLYCSFAKRAGLNCNRLISRVLRQTEVVRRSHNCHVGHAPSIPQYPHPRLELAKPYCQNIGKL